MFKILKYSFFDLIRSRWSLLYGAFFLVFTGALLFLSGDLARVVISLLNVVLILCPLIATMLGVMYFYNSREFVELLLAQPIPRLHIFWGQYLGLALSLSVSLVLGIGLPFLGYGLLYSPEIANFAVLLLIGVLLSFIFSGIAFFIALRNENRIRGFGLAIVAWLFFAVIYDGLLLLALLLLSDYPLEKLALTASLFNPIDLSRILILLKLDVSALMGYTGAVFEKFFSGPTGIIVAFGTLLLWVALPMLSIRQLSAKKDF